jgi:hypothetical protein
MEGMLGFALTAWVILAWLTHVIVSIQGAKWLLLIAGAIVFPVGCVHGTGIWFGLF